MSKPIVIIPVTCWTDSGQSRGSVLQQKDTKFEKVIKRMLETPPKPHVTKAKGAEAAAKKDKPGRA